MGSGEIVDVVDRDDNVVGQATRARVRAENLWHRASYVVALDERGRVFVHLRTATKDIFPSHYDVTVGGVVESGESYLAAAAREVSEELGVEPRALREVGELRFEDRVNRVVGRIFECSVRPPLVLQAEEIVSGEWLEVEEVARRIESEPFCPDGVIAFRQWRRGRSRRVRGQD